MPTGTLTKSPSKSLFSLGGLYQRLSFSSKTNAMGTTQESEPIKKEEKEKEKEKEKEEKEKEKESDLLSSSEDFVFVEEQPKVKPPTEEEMIAAIQKKMRESQVIKQSQILQLEQNFFNGFPQQIETELRKAVVIHSYTATDDTGFSVHPGDNLDVLSESENGWLYVSFNNQKGYVPVSHVNFIS